MRKKVRFYLKTIFPYLLPQKLVEKTLVQTPSKYLFNSCFLGIFNVGDLVWGTMKGFPSWPGKIVVPPDVPDLKRPAVKKLLHCIKFFGTYDYAWLAEQDVKPYLQFKESLSKGSKAQNFQRALKEIDEFSLGKKLIDSIKEPMDTSECGSPQLQIENVSTEKE